MAAARSRPAAPFEKETPMTRPLRRTLPALAAALLGAATGFSSAASAAESDLPQALKKHLDGFCYQYGGMKGDEDCDKIAVYLVQGLSEDRQWTEAFKDPKVKPAATKFCEKRCENVRGR
jgi:hypothetical protein